ncbi:UNKNOWN [Stylonychia lemnae]|uniref:Uncharacterized protein n=1 Tax=Stylonychia lemnae TaxID=5949 RepID=A0A077ZXB0_STYLE|nr:UNKNOWN [Stylonychia lemnae]|eukprot:CDW73176.1 UNKNOWN [Stylonychia lemnae]
MANGYSRHFPRPKVIVAANNVIGCYNDKQGEDCPKYQIFRKVLNDEKIT